MIQGENVMKKKVALVIMALVLVFLSNMVSNLKEAASERDAAAQVAVSAEMQV